MVDFKDEDGRRYGDWSKKDLRKAANAKVDEEYSSDKVWYKQTFWIVIFVLVFWPIGMVLTWRSEWPLVGKLLATAFVVFTVVGMVWIVTQQNPGLFTQLG